MDKQPDWPPQTLVTGFPWHDRHGEGRLPEGLTQFLDKGEPPLVFTLGTAIAEDAGAPGFFAASAAAAKLLGRRAVLMLNKPHNRPPVLPEGVVAANYAPFSELFPRAAVIVHHGGIGTTGLAMRSGRPMLVMPCAWDQPGQRRACCPARHRPHDFSPPLHSGACCRRAAPPAQRPKVHAARVGGRRSSAARGWGAGCL